MTLLAAPGDLFPQAFPLLVEVWQSASISQGEMNRRTSLALLTMKETNRINALFEQFPGRYRVVSPVELR